MIEIPREIPRKRFLGYLIVEETHPFTHRIFEVGQVWIKFSKFFDIVTKVYNNIILIKGYNRYALRKIVYFCVLRFFCTLLD
jgi:hypothetical protein